MADQTITQLDENSSPAGTDLFVMVDDPGGTPKTEKITFTNAFETTLITAAVGAASTSAAGKQENATAAETTTGTATDRTVTPDGLKNSVFGDLNARNTSDVTVGNTTDETSVFSATITGGDMGATGWLRVTVTGSIEQSSGGGVNFTVRLKLGATTLCSALATMLSGANVGAFRFVGYIANTSSSAQKATLYNEQLRTNVANQSKGITGTGAEDTSTNKTLDITAEWSAANANATLTKTIGMVELLP